MSENCVVTGGAGFIGSHLVEALVGQGHKVCVLDDLTTGNPQNLRAVEGRISFKKGSILDGELLQTVVSGASFVFHLAAVAGVVESFEEPIRSHEVNATGTLMVLEAAKATGARVVLSSSAAVYGSHGKPISPYGAQKLLGEQYSQFCLEAGVKGTVCLRYFNVYGPRQPDKDAYSGVIRAFKSALDAELPLTIHGDGSQTRDFIHVADIVRCNLLAMHCDADFCVVDVGTGTPVSIRDLAQTILDLADRRSEIVFSKLRAGDIHTSVANVEPAKRILGFESQISLQHGLRLLIQSRD